MRSGDKEKLNTFDTLFTHYGLLIDKDKPWFKALENIEKTIKNILFFIRELNQI